MAVEDPNSLKIGDTIRFKTLNPHDNLVWTGTIAAICDYTAACHFENPDAYYQDVIRANGDRNIGAKETLKYLVLNVSENTTTVTNRVFALEYIDKSTLELVQENTHAVFRVYGIDTSKANDILTYISALGYPVDLSFTTGG